ncbi:MAG: hypothetical protein U1F30_10130 [Steroidobacteraceae bacterium]
MPTPLPLPSVFTSRMPVITPQLPHTGAMAGAAVAAAVADAAAVAESAGIASARPAAALWEAVPCV